MTNLSPAAQAVLEAVCDNTEPDCDTQHLIAAALRAAADQTSPEKQIADINYVHQSYVDGMKDALAVLREIADELEGQDQLTGESD